MTISIALVQGGFIVGNIASNIHRVTAYYQVATAIKADLIVFPEMAISGYPPEDILFNAWFQERNLEALSQCASLTANGPAMLIGSFWREGDSLCNSAFLLDKGKVVARRDKSQLPNYGVFDERRYFDAGTVIEPIEWREFKLGVLICEDMWVPDVAATLKTKGAQLFISINASPFELGKPAMREQVASQRVLETGIPLIYVNQVGAQDELVFDGSSFIVDAEGEVCARMESYREDIMLTNLTVREDRLWTQPCTLRQPKPELDMIYFALVTGLRNFIAKNGFLGIVLGLSGGIDSALAAALAVDAVGKERVRALMLPSPVTSADSIEDATECARQLDIRFDIIPIEPGMQAFSAMMEKACEGEIAPWMMGDNQTRLRSSILMTISRKERLLLLNTGNKSEMAVGYTTMYGDMCGHYAVLKDVYKTAVYELAEWRNRRGEVIPARCITKAPSAELFPGQTDQDTLPPYAILDQILFQLVEQRQDVEALLAKDFYCDVVAEVSEMLLSSEYKRWQSAPGPKISCMSFGRDRRFPISNGWHVEQHQRLQRKESDS